MMNKALYLLPAVMLFFGVSAVAQKANIDSLTLVAQISEDQLKLGKLHNMVGQKTMNKRDAAPDARSSASNKAGDVKSDANKSRGESAGLDNLNKAILDLRSKIAVEQSKLRVYYRVAPIDPVIRPILVIADSTEHP